MLFSTKMINSLYCLGFLHRSFPFIQNKRWVINLCNEIYLITRQDVSCTLKKRFWRRKGEVSIICFIKLKAKIYIFFFCHLWWSLSAPHICIHIGIASSWCVEMPNFSIFPNLYIPYKMHTFFSWKNPKSTSSCFLRIFMKTPPRGAKQIF